MANESILKEKAEIICGLLQNQSIDSNIIQDSLREFSIKIQLGESGKLALYFSPKKNSFKYSLQGIKESEIMRKVELTWEKFVNEKWSVGVFEKESTEGVADVELSQASSENLSSLHMERKRHPDLSATDTSLYIESGLHKYNYDIYVDGSYLNDLISYGFVVLRNGEEIYLESAVVEKNVENEKLRQIGGEISGVENAIKYCKRKSITDVNIFYDYEGLAKWAQGEWKTNTQLTQNYKKNVNASGIKINWLKVEAHTGNLYNEKVDMLAKNIITQQIKAKR